MHCPSNYALALREEAQTGDGPQQGSQLGAGRSPVPQKLYEQCAHLFRLLLLHPVPGSIQEMKADHSRAGAVLHFVYGSGSLLDAPVAFACDIHRWDVDGAARECVHLGNALGIAAAPHAIALQGAGETGPAIFRGIDLHFGLG